MRINSTNTGQVIELKTKSNPQMLSEDKPVSREVVLSPEVEKTLKLTSQQEAAKAEKINTLRAQIQNGTYEVDFGKLAAKIMAEDFLK